MVVATLDVAIALDGEHRETPGQGVGEVVEGLSTQLGEVDGAVAVGPHDVVVACELDVLAVCLPASLLDGDQVVEVRAEADGRGGRQAGDAVDDGVCGGHLRGFFGFGFGKVVVWFGEASDVEGWPRRGTPWRIEGTKRRVNVKSETSSPEIP